MGEGFRYPEHIRYKKTEKLIKLIADIENEPDSLIADEIAEIKAADFLTMSQIQVLRSGLESAPTLRSLLMGSSLNFPEIEQRKKDPEFEKYLDRMRVKGDKAAYIKMTKNVDSTLRQRETVMSGVGGVKGRQQISGALNILSAIIGGFFVGFFLARTITDDLFVRIVSGLAGSVMLMILEVVLFILRDDELPNELRGKRKKKN